MQRFFRYVLLICCLGIYPFAWGQISTRFAVVANSDNDLLEILRENQLSYILYDTVEEAVKEIEDGVPLLLLAREYPERGISIDPSMLELIREKDLRVYLEYPESIPDISIQSGHKKIVRERGVVLSKRIAGLDSLDLLSINDHVICQVDSVTPIIGLAKLAGYDRADYGVDDVKVYPVLFQKGNLWIATTKLSDAIQSRFGPTERWKRVWAFILSELQGSQKIVLKQWKKDVRPMYDKDKVLPDRALPNSILAGTEWFYKSRLLIHPSWQDTFFRRTNKNGEGVVYPRISAGTPIGDGSLGILEGHASRILGDGTQPIRWWLRADCQAEVAFALSAAAEFLEKKDYLLTAKNLLNTLYISSNLRQGERSDPKSPSFGLIGWATTDPDAYYGDDNARVLLASIGASTHMHTHDWDTYIIEGLLGNFRTAGVYGFRGPWFRDAAMQKTSWSKLSERKLINIHPHYESWLWACYLWLYDKTGYEPLLSKAKQAIVMTMEAYPEWKWTNGIQQEYARMILPLAWLVRVEDTSQHRAWLDQIARKLLKSMQDSGAIREALGQAGMGRYERIKSNAEYGENEAPLISENGDPVSDALYTMNFAFFSLNEAFAATGDTFYKDALQKIGTYLLRIQVNSPSHPDLNGAWFRAFDYQRWDYWASNADSGWGPWGTQTGWTQSWILNSLMLTDLQENFWDQTKRHYDNSRLFKRLADQKIKQMLQ